MTSKILVVDFDGLNHEPLLSHLKSHFQFIFAKNYEEAKAVCVSEKVSLVVVRISVRPEGNYKILDFVEKMHREDSQIPVIALGKTCNFVKRKALMNSGLNGVLSDADLSYDHINEFICR